MAKKDIRTLGPLIKQIYEEQPDTNAFTDAERGLLESLVGELATLNARLDSMPSGTTFAAFQTVVTQMSASVSNAMHNLENEISTMASASDMKEKADIAAVNTALAGKASQGALDTLAGLLASKADTAAVPKVYQLNNPESVSKMFLLEATVSGGKATFSLVDAQGAALFASGPFVGGIFFTGFGDATPFMFGPPVVSTDRKTITVDVKKSTATLISSLSLSVLGAPVVANGSKVNALVIGK